MVNTSPDNAHILFVPICSKCGQRLYETVNFYSSNIHLHDGIKLPSYTIEPIRCPHCLRFFTQIAMPANFPFNGYGEKEI